jgi:hypothetical protein
MFFTETLTQESILKDIRTICEINYSDNDITLIERVLNDVIDLFHGKRTGYQACDTEYHNLFHTFQTIPPFVGMIDGWNKGGGTPRISKKYFTFGTIGVLLHDTGYIKTDADVEGTGAKYTFIHMERSVDFARNYLKEIGIVGSNIPSILNIIRCTGVTLDINIRFHNDEERIIGYALGTADLLGQMSTEDYIEKIPILYNEFVEAYRFKGLDKLKGHGPTIPECADDLIRSTPKFYEDVALTRFRLMGSLHEYLRYHFDSPDNPYLIAIEKNIALIRDRWK